MNANEPSPAFNLDELKLLPDWMKEDAPAPPGAARTGGGERDDRPPREARDPRQGDRPPFRRPGGGFGGGGGPDARGDRRPPGRDRRDDRGGPRRPGGGGNRDRRDDRGPRPPEPAPVFPARVRVEFLPDPRPVAGIAKEIRASHLAYPLFGLARMFLDRPERHRIRLRAESAHDHPQPQDQPQSGQPRPTPPAPSPAPTTLFQLGEDGPVATDRAVLERIAFDLFKDRFYLERSTQKDPPKGNFTNVARERATGTLLGPTNYHAYQANLRALYESRFSRRMDFEDFRRGVDVVTDPAMVERWKEEVRTITTYVVRDTLPAPAPEVAPAPAPEPAPVAATEAGSMENAEEPGAPAPVVEAAAEPAAPEEPSASAETDSAPAAAAEDKKDEPQGTVLESLAEARQHFRQHYFEGLLRRGTSFEIPGPVGRQLPEQGLTLALRLAHDRELKYPAGLVQPLRAGFQNSGLHIFKHRKRIVYVSASRPTPFRTGGETGGAVSEQVAAILETIAETPLIGRKQLAERVLSRRFGPAATLTPAAAAPADAGAATENAPASAEAATPAEPTAPEAAAPAPAADPRAEAVARAKAMLAADLRYLVQAGHVIEFHNGTFDLPLLPKPRETLQTAPAGRPTPPAPEPAAVTTAEPLPIADREKAPDATTVPPVTPPPENDDIFAPPVDPLANPANAPAPVTATADDDDGVEGLSPENAALAEAVDGPESLPPPPAGVEEVTDPRLTEPPSPAPIA